MSFLVYLFVLLVAAGSVIFGLDWTQAPLNPPPYATPPMQSAMVDRTPAPVAPTQVPATTVVRQQTVTVGAASATKHEEATQAQANAGDQADQPETTAAVAQCNIAACSASYRSFRASDCTYQPFGTERRVCTKTASTKRVAAATHPRGLTRRSEWRDDARVSDRRDYQDNRGGWGFGFFGNAYDDGR